MKKGSATNRERLGADAVRRVRGGVAVQSAVRAGTNTISNMQKARHDAAM